MKNIFIRTIKRTLISCAFGACKKVLLTGLIVIIAAVSLLPIMAHATPEMVDISMEVKRQVITMPDLYEHLLLTLKTGNKADGSDAVVVLQKKMNLLGTAPTPIGQVEMAGFIYVFFDITLDGSETTNAYQGSKIATSYVFYSRSAQKLNIFKIVSITGKAFEEMKNLNPGDKFTGVIVIDPNSGGLTTNPPNTTNPQYTTSPPYTNPPYTTNPQYTTSPPYTTNPSYTTSPPYTTTPQNTTSIQETTTTVTNPPQTTTAHNLPNTNDPAPIKTLISLSVLFAVLLLIQIIYLKRSKSKSSNN